MTWPNGSVERGRLEDCVQSFAATAAPHVKRWAWFKKVILKQEYTNRNGVKFNIKVKEALVPDNADYFG